MSSRTSSANSSCLTVSSFLAAPQNYWVTTKVLRDKVLADRNQGPSYANRKYAFKCTSAFQKRNLDNYPMPNTREDAQKSAQSHRTHRRHTVQATGQNTAYSGALKSYSKQMFEFAVKCANENHENNSQGKRVRSKSEHLDRGLNSSVHDGRQPLRRQGSSYSTTSNATVQCCASGSNPDRACVSRTGPTPEGSILYNNKQRVLNSIRLRPSSESQVARNFNNHRLSLRETSSDINRHFKVLQTNCKTSQESRRSSVAGSDYVFIPVGEESDYHVIPERVRHMSAVNSVFELNESDVSEDCFEEGTDGSLLNGYRNGDMGPLASTPPSHPHPPIQRPLLPPSTTSNIRLVSLDESSSSESDEEPEVPPTETKKADLPPSKTPQKGRGKIVIPEPEPEEKPAPPKLVLKGPKCWVDDATITSEPSDTEGADEADGAEHDPLDNGDKKLKPDHICAPKDNKQQNGDITNDSKAVGEVNGKENENLLLNELHTNMGCTEDVIVKATEPEVKEPEVHLPPFLCPSSERKSREAALKDWLSNTCFQSGNRHVPLV